MKKILTLLALIILLITVCFNTTRQNTLNTKTYIPEEARNLLNEGATKMRTGNYKEAAKYFQDLVNLYPDIKEGYLNLGLAYAKDNQLKKSTSYWEQAVKIDNKYSDAYYNLGLTYKILKNNNKAVENLTRYILLNPEDPHLKMIKEEISQLREPYLGSGLIGRISVSNEIDFDHNIALSVKDLFNPSTPYIYFCVEVINAPENTNIEIYWYYKTDDNQKIPVNSKNFHIKGSKNVILSLKKPDPEWPSGAYFAEISVNGVQNISVPFNIE